MTSADAATALVDPSYLADLDTMFGAAVTDTLVAPMLDELERAPVSIRKALATGNIVAVRATAHGLRGAALGLGCVGVANLCARLETNAADTLEELSADLASVATQTAAMLRAARG